MATFDEHAGLTKDQLQRAAALTVVAQSGLRVPFGDLFRERKTIVIFIRHFWCVLACVSVRMQQQLTECVGTGARHARTTCMQSRGP